MASEILHDIYYNPANVGSLAGSEKLFNATKNVDPSISQTFVNDWLKKQLTYTLHKPVRRHYVRNYTVASNINEQFQADLVDLREFKNENNGFQYLLTAIDVFSKYAFAVPIKTKSSLNVCNAFHEILKVRTPTKIQTDQGKEFVNKDFEQLCKKLGIHHFTTSDGEIKCAVVERFNRTLKSKMWKYFTYRGNRKYVDVLPKFIYSYNHSVHRSIGMKPIDVTEAHKEKIFKKLYGYDNLRKLLIHRRNDRRLKVGDTVRIKYHLGPLEKGYYPNWTNNIEEDNRK